MRTRAEWLSAGALVLAALAVFVPVMSLPAMVGVLLATLSGAPRWRRLVGVGGGLLAFAAFGRFVVETAAPNIIAAGQRSAEEKAVSRLREILWAEDRAKELGIVDTDRDGIAEYATLGELLGTETARVVNAPPDPLLKSGLYKPVAGATDLFRVEAYLVRVYPGLGGDADLAERAWVAYAWPAETAHGGRRAFFVDSDERICETSGASAYSGERAIPEPWAALRERRVDAERCGRGLDGNEWRPWKNKAARANPGGRDG